MLDTRFCSDKQSARRSAGSQLGPRRPLDPRQSRGFRAIGARCLGKKAVPQPLPVIRFPGLSMRSSARCIRASAAAGAMSSRNTASGRTPVDRPPPRLAESPPNRARRRAPGRRDWRADTDPKRSFSPPPAPAGSLPPPVAPAQPCRAASRPARRSACRRRCAAESRASARPAACFPDRGKSTHLDAACAQPLAEQLHLRRLADAVDAVEGKKHGKSTVVLLSMCVAYHLYASPLYIAARFFARWATMSRSSCGSSTSAWSP